MKQINTATSSKQSAHICLTFLTNSISHNSLHENTYSDELKQSEVISSYKKLGPLKKELEAHKPNCITGFRKLHDSQHCFVSMLETWKNALDKGDSVYALFLDFSKALILLTMTCY